MSYTIRYSSAEYEDTWQEGYVTPEAKNCLRTLVRDLCRSHNQKYHWRIYRYGALVKKLPRRP